MRKFFIFFGMFFLMGGEVIGQVVELDVPLIQQEDKSWCWAACVQMIDKFHNSNTTYTQCDLKNVLDFVSADDSSTKPILTLHGICTPSCGGVNGGINYRPIPVMTYQPKNYYYFDVFRVIGYYSIEDIHEISWNEIKAQINLNSAFVLIPYNYQPRLKCTTLTKFPIPTSHAIVAKGFWEIGKKCKIVTV
ncbi:MAG: Papain-like cysteine protease AvrRpt2, partial [Bacteroidota bacterium]